MSSGNRRRRFNVNDLFADTSPRATGVSDLVEAKQIQLERIEPDPNQPRNEFDEERLTELIDSIQAEGVLQPITVRYDEGRDIYVIIHGERRWRAAGRAGLSSMPAIVREVPEDRLLVHQLMENIIREDLNALDRAAALRALKSQMDEAPWEQVAHAVGIRRSRLFQLLGTEKLSPSLQDALRRGIVSEKQTRPVQALPDEVQDEIGSRLLAGTMQANRLDATARQLREARTGDDARNTLDTTEVPNPAEDHDRLVSTARRQTRSLAKTLDELRRSSSSGTDEQDLLDELDTLSSRIDDLRQRR